MDLLALVWVALLFISWPLLLAGLVVTTLLSGWRRRWRRAGLALAALAGLLIWSEVLPAIHRYRLETAIQRGSIMGAVPETLRGAQVLLIGAMDSRMEASSCGMLLGGGGVAALSQAAGQGLVSAQPDIVGVYDPAPAGAPVSDCHLREPGADDRPRPQWALLPEDHGSFRIAEDPAFDQLLTAQLGAYAARRVQLRYLLAPRDANGRILTEQVALAGFQVEVDSRPWWWSPLAPVLTETLRLQDDPALDRIRALTCGGDWPCLY